MRPGFAHGSGGKLNSFTLVELLVVIFIIVILTAIILSAAQGVLTTAARSRTKAEIQALATHLEEYKTDNGLYPLTNTFATTNAYATVDPTSVNYIASSQLLYEALSGKTNFLDSPAVGVKYYMNFKANQVGNAKAVAGSPISSTSTYVQDAFAYSYGYSTGTNSPAAGQPNNGIGFFDLWSTAGTLSSTANNTNTWINNWSPQ